MRSAKFVIMAFVVTMLVLGAVSVADAQTDDGMDGSNMDNGIDSEMNEITNKDGAKETTNFTVRIENVAPTDFYPPSSSTGGQIWVTPGAYAIHTGSNPAFTEGESASIGLEAQAEAGPPTGFSGQPGLVDELGSSGNVVTAGAFTPQNTVADPNDPMGQVPGAPPIAPGGAFEFEVVASSGQNLSFATMFVPSNDLFFAPDSDGIALYENGQPVSGNVTDEINIWDAGTEPNQEPGFGPDQAPAQSSPDQGDDEGGVVRPLSQVNDGFNYPSVNNTIRVTVTATDTPLPSGFPTFNSAVDVFDALDTNDDGNVSPGEMSRAVGEFLNSQTVGGNNVSPGEMSQIVGWFLSK